MQPAAAVLSAGIDGLLHPLVTPEHVVALSALALVSGRSAGSAISLIVAMFALGLAIGLGAMARGAGETPAGDVLLAGAALCGVTAASGIAAPAGLAAPVALISGFAVGLDSPPDAVRLDEAMAMLLGVGCSGVAALTAMAFAASATACWRNGVALRVAGSWIAAIATMTLAVRWAAR